MPLCGTVHVVARGIVSSVVQTSMPQLRVLGRRWRLASDMLPFLGLIFVALHVAIVCPVFIVFLAGTGGYECPEETLVYASILSTLGVNLFAMVHDAAMVFAGWRGGPMEEHKRKYMPSLVVSRIVLLIVSFGTLIFSTVLLYSPSIMKNCYAGDPCSKIPEACENGRLTEECDALYKSSDGEIVNCRNQWFDLAATYAVNTYNATAEPHYYSGEAAPDPSCNASVQANGNVFLSWQSETGEYFESFNPDASPGSTSDESRRIGVAWAQQMGFPNGSVVPWNDCLSQACINLVASVTLCEPYNQLIFFGDHSTEYSYALAAIWGSWALLLLIVIIFVLAYNAFPNYQEQDSWVKTVKSMARLCCFYSILKHTKTEDGEDAAEGLGALLHKLFGGIDLDQTDLLLGLYLVSERQSWRRFISAKNRIEQGRTYRYQPRRSRLCCCFQSCRHEQGCVDTKDIMMGATFELAGPCEVGHESSLHMEYSVMSFEDTKEVPIIEAATSPDPADMCLDGPYQAPQPLQIVGSRKLPSRDVESLTRGHTIVFRRDRKPYVTPFKFTTGHFVPKLQSKDAVDMYIGPTTDAVPNHILEQCRNFCWFAKASYGLQTVKWKDGMTGNWHKDTLDVCLGCLHSLGAKAVVKNHFRKRNLNAIIRYTKADPSDILHVSYTDTALGIIPYLVILDRESRSVVVSIRGTVDTADVITDLLSHPHDCSSSLPHWVLEELATMSGGDGSNKSVFCHRGILSSAKAILHDLDAKNILSSMENVDTIARKCDDGILETLDKTMDDHNEQIEILGQDEDVQLPIHRAQSIVHEAAGKGWNLVVTGHSLGAAVASLISFNLRERFPDMECFAFNPPGGVMDPRLSEISKKFCTSVIVGMDLISRLSTGNMSALIDDLVLALGRCKLPKLSIFFGGLFGRRHDPATTLPTYYSPEEISPEVQKMLLVYLKTSTVHMDIKDAKLFPPGNLIFLRPLFDIGNSKKPPTWDAVYINKNDLMEEGILLSREALEHHHLWTTLEALQNSIYNLSLDDEHTADMDDV